MSKWKTTWNPLDSGSQKRSSDFHFQCCRKMILIKCLRHWSDDYASIPTRNWRNARPQHGSSGVRLHTRGGIGPVQLKVTRQSPLGTCNPDWKRLYIHGIHYVGILIHIIHHHHKSLCQIAWIPHFHTSWRHLQCHQGGEGVRWSLQEPSAPARHRWGSPDQKTREDHEKTMGKPSSLLIDGVRGLPILRNIIEASLRHLQVINLRLTIVMWVQYVPCTLHHQASS